MKIPVPEISIDHQRDGEDFTEQLLNLKLPNDFEERKVLFSELRCLKETVDRMITGLQENPTGT